MISSWTSVLIASLFDHSFSRFRDRALDGLVHRMRALHDPDAFLAQDLGVRHAFEGAGLPGDARSVETHSQRWRPWRAYALMHLWASLSDTPSATRARPILVSHLQRRPSHDRYADQRCSCRQRHRRV